jgi:hypothetical protein
MGDFFASNQEYSMLDPAAYFCTVELTRTELAHQARAAAARGIS